MRKKTFKYALKYNIKHVKEYDENYTLNLSSLLYTPNEKQRQDIMNFNYIFDIKSLINPDDVIISIGKNNQNGINIYQVITHPYIVELGKAFGYDFSMKETTQEEILFELHENAKDNVYLLINKIRNFIIERNFLFTYEDISFISDFTDKNNDELLKLLKLINKTFYKKDYEFHDYFPLKSNKKITEKIPLERIHNYQTLSDFCKKIVLRNKEYYDEHYNYETLISAKKVFEQKFNETDKYVKRTVYKKHVMKLQREIENIDNIIDEINSSPLFSKETFSYLFILLSNYVEKEKAINNFIEKILKDS